MSHPIRMQVVVPNVGATSAGHKNCPRAVEVAHKPRLPVSIIL